MPRSSGTYTAPSSSVNPAVEGTTIDETDFNNLVDDIESALTESVYTSGVGSTDNRLVRVDGTDTKKVQGSAATLDDSGNLSGIANLAATGYLDVSEMSAPGNPASNVGRIYVADDSGTTKLYFKDAAGTATDLLSPPATISDGDKGDITTSSSGATWTIDNNAVTYAKLQDVSATSRVLGRKTSGAGDAEELTASEVLDFISTTQGELLYRDASAWAALGVGTSGQVLQSQGAGANPQWATVAGTGDVTSASNITDNRIVRGDGGAKGVQESAIAIDDSGNVTGVVALDIGNADTTLTRSGAGDVAIEGNIVYRAGGTDVALADGGTGASLTDPNADRLLFWDDSAGAVTWLEAGSGLSISGTTISASGSGGGAAASYIDNLTLAASVSGNALTIAIKNLAGNDPSVGDPIAVNFRSATASSGSYVARTITAANSLVISSGSTLGTASGVACRLWVVLFDDAGTLRLGAVNCLSGYNIFPLGRHPIASSTAEGGAGGADSSHVFYSGSAVSSKPYVILGYLEWSSGLTTAGTWNAAPSIVQLYGPGIPKPGDVIQTVVDETTTVTSTTSTSYVATNIAMDITPTSACNVIRMTGGTDLWANGSSSAAASWHRGTTDLATQASVYNGSVAAALIAGFDIPPGTSTYSYNIRLKTVNAATTAQFAAGTGGVNYAYGTVEEIMA